MRGVFGSVDCIIGTMGQEERVRTATKESGEAFSEGNVAENMTVPRKADRANRLDYKATAATMCDCTATATLSALQITTTVKVSQKGSSEIFILHDKSLHLQKGKSVP